MDLIGSCEAYAHPTFPPTRLHGITVNGHRCRVLAVVPDYRLAVADGSRAVEAAVSRRPTVARRGRPSRDEEPGGEENGCPRRQHGDGLRVLVGMEVDGVAERRNRGARR